MAVSSQALRERLAQRGVEYFAGDGASVSDAAVLEPPCGIKWLDVIHAFTLGAFSYGVSGFCNEVEVGRYCSFGEHIQVGRGAHPTAWMSTSPFFYNAPPFAVGHEFDGAEEYHRFRPGHPGDIPVRNGRTVNDFLAKTRIGHDVWIGHGAFVAQGVTIGNGAVVAGASVVTKDVPPYAIVGGNPAQILRMRFSFAQSSALERLAWWRFAPWQLNHVPFANIDDAIARLEDRVPGLTPFAPTKVRIADVMTPSPVTQIPVAQIPVTPPAVPSAAPIGAPMWHVSQR